MKCDVLVQVSLFKKEKLKKHFWQLKCYVGLQPFFGICEVVTINIVLDQTEPQTTS